MRVAVFGGSFNPPHVAHVLVVVYALSVGGFERVLVVPVHEHPFHKPLAPFEDRVRMAELAMGWLPGVEISRVEAQLASPSLTLRTLERLHRDHPDWELRLVVGSDVVEEAPRWHSFESIVHLAPLFVVGRAGAAAAHDDRPVLPQISSTLLRQMLGHRQEPSVRQRLELMLPRAVLEYIEEHGLYR